MGRKKNRSILTLILVCGAAGVILGGTASWAESNTCLQETAPSTQCLKESPLTKTIEGMSAGLVAGMSAALGAAWQAKRAS